MGSLDGRVALITGAGRGIGRQEALFFAAEGAKVVVNDPGVEPDGSGGDNGVAASVVAEIAARGGTAVANSDSVADWNGSRRMVETALDTYGDLHIVVNNATVMANEALTGMTESQFDDVIAVKMKGTFAVSHWAARYWQAQHAAGVRADRAVINTSSGSGLLNPLPKQTNYAAANAGIAAMTVVNALELGRYGVRVNCISPSMARTRLTQSVPGMHDPAVNAPVAAFLASAGCPLTGQVLSVRGGSVAVEHGWSRGPQVHREGSLWTVSELAEALAGIPFENPFDKLAAVLGDAFGVDSRSLVEQMINS